MLTKKQLATVRAALRYWRDEMVPAGSAAKYYFDRDGVTPSTALDIDALVASQIRLTKQEQASLFFHSGISKHAWDNFARMFNSRLGKAEKHSQNGGIMNRYNTLNKWCVRSLDSGWCAGTHHPCLVSVVTHICVPTVPLETLASCDQVHVGWSGISKHESPAGAPAPHHPKTSHQ